MELMNAAKMFQLPDLKKYLLDMLMKNVGKTNAVDLFKFGNLFSITDLKEICICIMSENSNTIGNRKDWLEFMSEEALMASEVILHVTQIVSVHTMVIKEK